MRPATNGPSPKPADSAIAALLAPDCSPAVRSYGGTDSSLTQAVPAARTHPLAVPAKKRPRNSKGVECAPTISTKVATTDITADGRTTRRRPHRSDARPPRRRAGTRTRAEI